MADSVSYSKNPPYQTITFLQMAPWKWLHRMELHNRLFPISHFFIIWWCQYWEIYVSQVYQNRGVHLMNLCHDLGLEPIVNSCLLLLVLLLLPSPLSPLLFSASVWPVMYLSSCSFSVDVAKTAQPSNSEWRRKDKDEFLPKSRLQILAKAHILIYDLCGL